MNYFSDFIARHHPIVHPIPKMSSITQGKVGIGINGVPENVFKKRRK
jgi:hypothetical protein